MKDAQIVAELGIALTAALGVVRYWRQIAAFLVAVVVALTVIGAITVMSWFDGPLQ